MPRIMAFDYGTKRIGIAVTDPLQIIATGLETIHPKDSVAYLQKYLAQEDVCCFVVGEPRRMDGSHSDVERQIKGFLSLLNKHFPHIPIERMDERFTSKMASSSIAQSGLKKSDRQSKELVDTVSATLILQSYLEKKAHGF
jgi:putative Holliday junction resolvase